MSELNQPASKKGLIIGVIVAIAGALGVSVSVSDNSPILNGCGEESAPAPVGGSSAAGTVSGAAGVLASDDDAGVSK